MVADILVRVEKEKRGTLNELIDDCCICTLHVTRHRERVYTLMGIRYIFLRWLNLVGHGVV